MTDLERFIRDIPDFPKPGIMFKDITPMLQDGAAFQRSVDALAEALADVKCDAVLGIESRGFLFGPALALAKGVGFVPVRKPGKLPYKVVSQEYSLEYGTDSIEIHSDALSAGQTVVVVDDLIATGGTASAACDLVEGLGATVAACAFIISLDFLPWRERMGDHDVRALLRYT